MPERFVLDLAGRPVGFETLCKRLPRLARDYQTSAEPLFTLTSSMDELYAEEARYVAEYPGTDPYDGMLEMIVMLRKVADAMVDYDTFLMHGAVIAVDGAAYMFTARSGTGKTTHLRRWLEQLPEATVVNGDKPLIIAGRPPMACGTPWSGKERMHTNLIVPLKAIVFMDRAEQNRMRRISFLEALPRLLEQTHRPADAAKMRKTLSLLSSLNGQVDFWHFDCNNYAEDAFAVSYGALTGNSPLSHLR